jgi:hypothetical protein
MMSMRSWKMIPLLVLAGCAGGTPETVFRRSAHAFSDGDVGTGTSHFSRRLQEARPLGVLETYYRSSENRKGMAFLLRDSRFRIVREQDGTAVGEVTWTTGRTEPVYFVLEGGAWKLDLPPGKPPSERGGPSPLWAGDAEEVKETTGGARVEGDRGDEGIEGGIGRAPPRR